MAKADLLDPSELREARDLSSPPEIPEGTPPYGIQTPTSPIRLLSAVALSGLIKRSPTPMPTEELNPRELRRLLVHPKTPLPTEEISPEDFRRLLVDPRTPLPTETLTPIDLARMIVPLGPKLDLPIGTCELVDELPTDHMSPVQISRMLEPARQSSIAGEIRVLRAVSAISLVAETPPIPIQIEFGPPPSRWSRFVDWLFRR